MAKYLNLAGAQYLINKVKGLISVKADTTTVNAALDLKANAADMTTELGKKANNLDVNNALALKADTETVNAALAGKASTEDLTNGLAAKADTETVNAALAGKASTEDLTNGLAAKASTEDLTNGLAAKANITDVNNSLDGKANVDDVYTKQEVDAKVASVYVFKGSVANYAALPTEGNAVGHVYNIEAADTEHGINAGDNVAWDGTKWDKLAGTITFDTSGLLPTDSVITNEEIDGMFAEQAE